MSELTVGLLDEEEGIRDTGIRKEVILDAEKELLDEDNLLPTISLPELEVDHRYQLAAVYCLDAIHNRSINHGIDKFSLMIYKIYYHSLFKWLLLLTTTCLIGITMFESPAIYELPNFSLYILCLFEVLLLMPYWIEVVLQIVLLKNKRVIRSYDIWLIAEIVILILSYVDIISYCLMKSGYEIFLYPYIGGKYSWMGETLDIRLTRVLRSFFVVKSTVIMKMSIVNIFKSLPEILNFLLLVFVAIFFFMIFGVQLFSPQCDMYFMTFYDTFISLFVLMTTANYPDVMMTEYDANPLTFFYFMSFLLITLYFLMNLVLASMYNRYIDNLEKFVQSQFNRRVIALGVAFQILDVDMEGVIDYPTFRNLMYYIRKDYSSETVKLIFSALDDNDDGFLYLSNFYNLCEIFSIELEEGSKDERNIFEKISPRFYNWSLIEIIKNFVNSVYFEYIIDGVIILNGIVLIVELQRAVWFHNLRCASNLDREEYTHDGEIYTLYSVFIMVVFLIEMILKVFSKGFKGYWRSSWNKFDMFIVFMSIFGVFFDLFTDESIFDYKELIFHPLEYFFGNNEELYIAHLSEEIQLGMVDAFLERIFNLNSVLRSFRIFLQIQQLSMMLRIIRLMRIMVTVPVFRDIIQTAFKVLPPLVNFILLQCSVFYIFAIIGMGFFAYSTTDAAGNPRADSHLLNISMYAADGYYNNNFNNVLRSFVTLFELMVVNNWHVIMSGFTAVKGNWASIYFIVFFLVSVVVILNVVIAFMLETFISHWEAKRKGKSNELSGDSMRMISQKLVLGGKKVKFKGRARSDVFLRDLFKDKLVGPGNQPNS